MLVLYRREHFCNMFLLFHFCYSLVVMRPKVSSEAPPFVIWSWHYSTPKEEGWSRSEGIGPLIFIAQVQFHIFVQFVQCHQTCTKHYPTEVLGYPYLSWHFEAGRDVNLNPGSLITFLWAMCANYPCILPCLNVTAQPNTISAVWASLSHLWNGIGNTFLSHSGTGNKIHWRLWDTHIQK